MDYIDRYRERVLRGNTSLRDLTKERINDSFEKYMQESPTVHRVQVTDIDEPYITNKTKYIDVAINDFADNDQRLLDEKDIYVRRDENIGVGCYLYYDNCEWLITFEEHTTIQIKRHFIMRRCNNYITVKYAGELHRIPISVENLTMYSDGVADNILLSFMDSKKQIWYGSNPITRNISENFRIILTHNTAFRITHINDFEYNGLIKSLVLQTAIIDGDKPEIRYANNDAYYDFSYTVDNTKDDEEKTYDKILGEELLSSGEQTEFFFDSKKHKNIVWSLEKGKCFKIISQSEQNCIIESAFNMKYIGSKDKIIVQDRDTKEIIDTLDITMRR